MSQTQWILEELQRGRSVSPIDALAGCQCFRLAARIQELRLRGHNVVTIIVKRNGKKYATYRLIRSKA